MIALLLPLAFVVICLGIALFLVATCYETVGARQALVILERSTGSVRLVVVGPKRTIVVPLIEDTLRLDLTAQKMTVTLQGLATADCLPVDASLDVFYALDPALLTAADMNEILPFLTKIEPVAESWTAYILRSLFAGTPTSDLLSKPQTRARLERLLQNTLQANVQRLGVQVSRVRLIIHPAAKMLEANLEAQIRAKTLATLGAMLGPTYNQKLAQVLPLEQLRKTLPLELQMMAAINLAQPTALGGNGTAAQTFPILHWVLNTR